MQMKALLLSIVFSTGVAIQVRAPVAAAPTVVPVPEAPTATLPPVPEKLSCKKLDTCLAENGGNDAALKTCVMRDLGDEKGQKVWGILSKARLADKKPSLALLKISKPAAYTAVLQALFSHSSKVLLVADLCVADAPTVAKVAPAAKVVAAPAVKVPNATSDCDKGKGLPTPHGHPQAASEDRRTQHENPATCKKLDACLEKVDHAHYLAGYESCITDFCQTLHGDKEFKEKDDPRTGLCDKKGLEAMDVLAKAAAEAKALGLHAMSDAQARKMAATPLALVETKPSVVLFSVVQTLFSKSSTAVELAHACRI